MTASNTPITFPACLAIQAPAVQAPQVNSDNNQWSIVPAELPTGIAQAFPSDTSATARLTR
jgi:hypothetical protein